MTTPIQRALVTGASSGIGASLAHRLAAEGVRLVLVARREERLEELADRLPGGTEILVADLADPAGLDAVEDRLTTRRDAIDLLVNNAGLGAYGSFVQLDDATEHEMLAVNVGALTRLTRAVLPGLVERGRGGVINVGSTAGFQPGPFGAVYGATKAYVRSFTEAVHEEVRSHGVHVMLLAPGVTSTEFQQVAEVDVRAIPAMAMSDPDRVARAALAAFAAGRTVCIPGSANRIGAVGARLAPSVVSRRAAGVALRRLAS